MRTLSFLFGGLALYIVLLGIGKAVHRPRVAFISFLAVWLGIAVWNMWAGVVGAGYSILEELPIFALIYLVPVSVAYFINKRLGHHLQ